MNEKVAHSCNRRLPLRPIILADKMKSLGFLFILPSPGVSPDSTGTAVPATGAAVAATGAAVTADKGAGVRTAAEQERRAGREKNGAVVAGEMTICEGRNRRELLGGVCCQNKRQE